MAVFLEGRQVILEADLELSSLPPAGDQGRIGGDTVDPGAQSSPAIKAIDPGREGQEDVLHDFLGIGLGARDGTGHPVDARGMAGHERFQRRHVALAQALDQDGLGVGVHARASRGLGRPAP